MKENNHSNPLNNSKPLRKCSECGLCKRVCPIYKATSIEYESPRAKAILRKNSAKDKVFFDCTLCMACQQVCPLKIDFDFIEIRKDMIKAGLSPTSDKEMVENMLKYGSPFGKVEKGKKPDKLYCC